jgi:hypothetical protein
MQAIEGISKGIAIAIDDLLDNCAEIKPGQEVVLLAHIDGIYGGDNLVDPRVIAWLQAGIQYRGANASIIWIDEPAKPHAWRIPPLFMAALEACDVFISHSFDITTEEFGQIWQKLEELGKVYVRNLATTPSLLNTAWAQTPYELVSQIRYQASTVFREGLPFQLTDDNGTHLEGTIDAPNNPACLTYTTWRKEGFSYRPFPEIVFPPIRIADTSGIFVFDRMLTWWSRYVGVPPFFKNPIQLTIEKNYITKIEGEEEAACLRKFLVFMKERIGDSVYSFPQIHSGVHPRAEVGPHQCASPLYRRMIEHSHSCNIHGHIGGRMPPTPKYPYCLHITGDIRNATWRVGQTLVHNRGRLTALDDPKVLAVAAKYPDRPGIEPGPRCY